MEKKQYDYLIVGAGLFEELYSLTKPDLPESVVS